MDQDSINCILDNCKGLRRDRLLKIASGQLKIGDAEFSQHLKNELIKTRRMLIEYFKIIEEENQCRKEYLKYSKHFQNQYDIVMVAEIQLKISDIDKVIGRAEKSIVELGEFLTEILKTDLLTEHEICQLFNINFKTWEDKKARYHKMCKADVIKEHLVYSVLSVTGPEYRHRKGRMKDIYDCPDSEMPIYWALHEHMMDVMKNNEEFHDACNKKFKELWPDLKTYKVIKDLEGNIIQIIENK